jgi:undecaprenyl-diphosphatase
LKSYRTFLIASAVFLLCAVLLGLQAKGAGPLPGDTEFSNLVQGALPFNGFTRGLSNVMRETLRYLPFAILAVLLGTRKWDWAILVAVACLPVMFWSESLLKPLFARPRPTADVVTIYQASKGLSFPSGTAMQSAAMVGVALYLARLAGKSMLSTVVTALSLLILFLSNVVRVHVGAHWTSDIIGGWLFGSAWVALLLAGHQWWLSRDSGPAHLEED